MSNQLYLYPGKILIGKSNTDRLKVVLDGSYDIDERLQWVNEYNGSAYFITLKLKEVLY